MPKYKCINKLCDFCEKIISVNGTKIRIREGKVVDINQKCPDCGEEREVVRESGMTSMIAGTKDQELRKEKNNDTRS